jgi:hypothetical protein
MHVCRGMAVVVLAGAVTGAIACGGLDGLTGGSLDAGMLVDANSGEADSSGGARRDAGATDAGWNETGSLDDNPGPTDGGDATASGSQAACPPFAVFCDDFELGNLSRWTGTDILCNGSNIGVYDGSVPPRPFRGSYGLQAVVLEAGVASCAAQATAIFPTVPSPGVLAVRVYINGATLQPGANADFMWVRPSDSYTSSAAIFDGPTGFSTAVSSNFVERGQNSAVSVPSGWFCLEWDIIYAPSGGRQMVFVDRNTGNGLELVIDDVDVDFNDASATWNALDLGVVSGGVINSAVDLRYDDLAIATFPGAAAADAGPRIGCE